MSIYKLQAAGVGGAQDGAGALDIQFEGTITAIHGSMVAVLDLASEFCQAEVNFLSVNTINSNDSRGSLLIIQAQASGTGVGVPSFVNSGVGPMDVPVAAGERVFLHLFAAAGVISTVQFHLYVRDGAVPALRRRR